MLHDFVMSNPNSQLLLSFKALFTSSYRHVADSRRQRDVEVPRLRRRDAQRRDAHGQDLLAEVGGVRVARAATVRRRRFVSRHRRSRLRDVLERRRVECRQGGRLS